tara:strand:+ start:3289 stop:3645 length:357 start_codon:yes stop_codon:yes gene_type:complete
VGAAAAELRVLRHTLHAVLSRALAIRSNGREHELLAVGAERLAKCRHTLLAVISPALAILLVLGILFDRISIILVRLLCDFVIRHHLLALHILALDLELCSVIIHVRILPTLPNKGVV